MCFFFFQRYSHSRLSFKYYRGEQNAVERNVTVVRRYDDVVSERIDSQDRVQVPVGLQPRALAREFSKT